MIRQLAEEGPCSSSPSSWRPNITSYLLIDPIPILLHLPDVAYNFLYRVPKRANEWQLWYFASRDPDIAHTLGRHFFWTDNVLWRDDLILEGSDPSHAGRDRVRKPIAVVLASEDQIVPAKNVRRYLTGEDEAKAKWVSKCGTLQVLYNPGLDHATVFDTKERRRGMVEVLEGFCGLRKER